MKFSLDTLSQSLAQHSQSRYSVTIMNISHESVDRVLRSSYQNFELIISDNKSSDSTVEYLQTIKDKRVRLCLNDSNLGFIDGNIKALSMAKGKYFVLLNNDMMVAENWLDEILKGFASDPLVRIVGPIDAILNTFGNGCALMPSDQLQPDYIEGSCLAVPSALVRKIGLFDTENLSFAYCEDSDLNLRVRARGYTIKRVYFKYEHKHAATAKIVTTIDLKSIQQKNASAFRNKWVKYLVNRSFSDSIVMKRTAAIGDVFLVESIVQALIDENRFLKVTFVTNSPHLLKDNPSILKICESCQLPVDYSFDQKYESEPKMFITDAYRKGIKNISQTRRLPKVYLTQSEKDFVKADVRLKKKYVVCHFEPTTWESRNLPLSVAQAVIDRLAREYTVVELGKRHIFRNVEDFTNIDIKLSCSIIRGAEGFIGNDSSLLHVAQSFETPGTAVFGCIDPQYRIFNDKLMVPTIPSSTCKFCHHDLPSPRTFTKCSRGDNACLASITCDEVIKNFKKGVRGLMAISETEKIRDVVLPFCQGRGIDIGCRHDKITPTAIGVDSFDTKGVDFVIDASKRLPFNDKEMDYVYSSHCLGHIEDTETTLQEWLRVLKVGGHISLYLPHRDLYTVPNPEHLHNFVNSDIEAIFTKLGCQVVKSIVHSGADRYSFLVVGKKL